MLAQAGSTEAATNTKQLTLSGYLPQQYITGSREHQQTSARRQITALTDEHPLAISENNTHTHTVS